MYSVMVCPSCGLPEEICICDEGDVDVEPQVSVDRETRRRNTKVTLVGIDNQDELDVSMSELETHLKTRFACGGTTKNGLIELQGEHSADDVKEAVVNFVAS